MRTFARVMIQKFLSEFLNLNHTRFNMLVAILPPNFACEFLGRDTGARGDGSRLAMNEGGNGERAWWHGSAIELARDEAAVLGRLAGALVAHHSLNRAEQLHAWQTEIRWLSEALAAMPEAHVILEYALLRLGRRIDAVILLGGLVLVLEFKASAAASGPAARRQVEDYALDLQDFHAASRTRTIVPILVVPDGARLGPDQPLMLPGCVLPVIDVAASHLGACLARLAARDRGAPIDPLAWIAAAYRPVPTIIEAATMLYARHGVAEISAARADTVNLTHTTTAIAAAITAAEAERRRVVVFVTGIPGSGKTLCGLNVVFGRLRQAAYLSGNLPLVHVLRAALVREARQEQGRDRRAAAQEAEAAIQPLLGFLRDNRGRPEPPHEHVIVFDEAQRAWDAPFGRRKFGLDDSEAAVFLDIMARHADWAVIVALVGSGQEINTGEAGLASWGEALARRPEWQAWLPDSVIGGSDPRRRLFAAMPTGARREAALHLDVPVRSLRSDAAAPWVEAVLAGDAARARRIAVEAGGVPFRLTRSLDALRQHLRAEARGTRRAGLVCSADAKRLRGEGLSTDFPHLDADAVANWFLRSWPDVRASDALELPATQFACQGLELDHVGLCWGGDLIRHEGDGWQVRKFRGSAWQIARGADDRAWRLNTYRVLLTRARYETAIYVPGGDAADVTRAPEIFDRLAAYLADCGAVWLGRIATPDPAATAVETLL